MPMLRKTKLDAITKARLEGYTQKETAERVRVDIKTVKKYDPIRSEKKEVDSETRIERLESICNSLVVEVTLLIERVGEISGAVGNLLDKEGKSLRLPSTVSCPKCEGRMIHDDELFRCVECDFSATEIQETLWIYRAGSGRGS